jgi:hypothetical protein
MIIQSINGRILYESAKTGFKAALEEAVAAGIDLSHGDFRKRKLYRAKLDGIKAPGSTFWGADCRGADLAGANLRETDFRVADMQDVCLAQSDCRGANFTGAHLSGAILRHCNMQEAVFSCPSLFASDYEDIAILDGAVYNHRGEVNISLDPRPVLVRGLSRPIILAQKGLIWGNRHISGCANDPEFEQDVRHLKATIGRFA